MAHVFIFRGQQEFPGQETLFEADVYFRVAARPGAVDSGHDLVKMSSNEPPG